MSVIFAQLPMELQEALATNAGIMLSSFDPENVGSAEEVRANIIFATNGGVNVVCAATHRDYGADIDNCPTNTWQMDQIENWNCEMSGTAVTVKGSTIARLLGAADSETAASGDMSVITPRYKTKETDYQDLWYVCPYGTNGGFFAVHASKTTSYTGLSFQSANNGKGQWAFNLRAMSDFNNPEVVPMKFYLKKTLTAAVEEVNVTGTEEA